MTALDGFWTSTMKTRVIHTKYWMDSYILKLPTKGKCLFNFYITNDKIGLIGIYEIPRVLVQVSTGMSIEEIEEYNQRFMNDEKIIFSEDWVCVVNVNKYQTYTGEKNEKAKEKEWKMLPLKVRGIFSKYSIDTLYANSDTLRNKKPEIKEQKPEIVTDKDIDEIAEGIEAQKRAKN